MSFFSNLFKKKTTAPTSANIEKQEVNEQDEQAAHAKQIAEKIKHYQTHGKPKASQVDDPTFNEGANQLAKEDYGSLFSRQKNSQDADKNAGKK